MSRTSKMMQYVNWRMRVQISERRTLLGTFMAYDKHMNMVLGDTEEYRLIRGKGKADDTEVKRTLGLVLLRGENVIAISAETPPPPKSRAAQAIAAKAGPGQGRAAGRGMGVAPIASAPKGLSGPVRGVGGPASAIMTPQATITGGAVNYGRGQMMPGPPGGMGMRPPFGMPPMGMPPMGRPGMPFNPAMMGRGAPPPRPPM
jgi:small nuclear ribonucleoprotein B and B'